MELDVATYGHPLRDVGPAAARAEQQGFSAWLTSEVTHDPFLAVAAAALATERIQVGTAIAVAFARNPMTIAYAAQDLQQALGPDRPLLLGLGSQIKPHVTRRFSEPWPDRPATAMREFVQALHAIWDSWNDGAPLRFEGERYRHTLMTPMFAPTALPARPRVWVAAVGPGMTRVAGQVADGLLCHGFTTARYLADTTVPALEEGIGRAEGRSRADVEVVLPMFVVTGYDAAEREQARQAVLAQIGFYGSTPAYRPVLDAHGWGALGDELHHLSTTGGWAAMPDAIDEEVLDAFAVVADPDQLGPAIAERVGGLVDRVQLPAVLPLRDEHVTALRETLLDAT